MPETEGKETSTHEISSSGVLYLNSPGTVTSASARSAAVSLVRRASHRKRSYGWLCAAWRLRELQLRCARTSWMSIVAVTTSTSLRENWEP